ncbi:putative DD34D transposase [Trichonephila clavipes]|nr:putative DD34D transposase [Trichonephila clavipes]
MDRIFICETLVKRNEIGPFLKWMVTGDEKWVTYDNIVRKRSWPKCDEAAQTVTKQGLSSRKVLLRICDSSANRRDSVFRQDNATPDTLAVTLGACGWGVLMHPPYSRDITPNDYPLFSRIAKFPE